MFVRTSTSSSATAIVSTLTATTNSMSMMTNETESGVIGYGNWTLPAQDGHFSSRDLDPGIPNEGVMMTSLQMAVIGALLVTLVVVTISGNLLVCVTITTDRKLRTPTNYFLLSLAVADMLLGIGVLPVSAFATLNSEAGNSWPLGSTFCNIYVSADVTLCTASILVLFAISVDRYLAVRYPLRYHQAVCRRLVWKINAAVWTFSAAIGFVPIHLGWNTIDGKVQNVEHPDDCQFELNAGYVLLIGVGTYFLPLAIMCTVYAKVLQISRRQVKAIQRLSRSNIAPSETSCANLFRPSTNRITVTSDSIQTFDPEASTVTLSALATSNGLSTPDVLRPPLHASCSTMEAIADGSSNERRCGQEPAYNGDSFSLSAGKKLHSKAVSDRKAVVTLASVVAAFAVCWIPYFALFVAKPFLRGPVDHHVDQMALWLGYANSSVNPFLYAFHSHSFRDGFRRVLCRRHRSGDFTGRKRRWCLAAGSSGQTPPPSMAGGTASASRDLDRCSIAAAYGLMASPVTGANSRRASFRERLPPTVDAGDVRTTSSRFLKLPIIENLRKTSSSF